MVQHQMAFSPLNLEYTL